jgi:5-oxoprolinase (ATP-hydrolysing)
MKGYDAAAHVLACFGGAGAQHACAIATSLGMSTIFVHRCGGQEAMHAGLLPDVHFVVYSMAMWMISTKLG